MNSTTKLALCCLIAAALPAQESPVQVTPRARELTEQDRQLLQSPDFRRRLVESYAAESDVEPKIATPAEREALQAIFDLITADKLDEALQKLHAQAKPGANAVFDFTLGNLHYQRDELEPAAAAYDAAVLKYPKFRRAWGNLGQIRFRQGDFATARRAFARTIELGGADAVTFGLLGVAHSRSGDDIAAESAFRMASTLAPDTIDWKMGLAESLFRQRRFADAVALFGGLIEAHPERTDLWRFQGEAHAMLGDVQKAIENFEMMDLLGGASPATIENLGDLYANQQLFDLAVRSYLRAIERNEQGRVDRALRAAKFMCASGALAETRELTDGIARLRPQLGDADKKQLLSLRASLAVAEGAGQEEASVLEQLVQLDPLDGDSLILLGRYYERSGDAEKAVFQFERAASMAAFEPQAKLSHAQLLVRQGKYVDALPLLRRAVELQPRESWAKFLEQVEAAAKTRT